MSISRDDIYKGYNFLKDEIPYRNLLRLEESRLDGAVIQNFNNSVFVVWELFGQDDKNSEQVLNERAFKFSEMISSVFDSSWQITFDYSRVPVKYDEPLVKCEEGLKNAQMVQDLRYRTFTQNICLFENKAYLSLSFTPKNRLKSKTAEVITFAHIRELQANVEFCESYFPMCGFNFELLKYDRLITYLDKTVSLDFEKHNSRDIIEPEGDLNEIFASVHNINPDYVPLVIDEKMTHIIPLTYLPTQRFWNSTYSNMFEMFSLTNYPVRFFIKFKCNSQKESEEILYARKNKLAGLKFRVNPASAISSGLRNESFSDDEVDLAVLRGIAACDNAIMHQQEENLTGGYLSAFIFLSAKLGEEDKLDEMRRDITGNLSELGLKVPSLSRTRLLNTRLYAASMIGTSFVEKNCQRFSLTDNVASMILVGATTDYYYSVHLEEITGSKIPFMMGLRGDSLLYKFSPSGKRGNHGHTFMAGETGGGKSITLAHMSNEWLKYKNTRVVYFDMGLSCLKTVLDNGGKMFYPGLDSTAFCPFKNAKDRFPYVLNFLNSIAVGNGFEITPAERRIIKDVVMTLPYGLEDFETFFAIYKGVAGDTKLTQALQQYIDVYGEYFNSKDDSFINLPRITGIELTRLLTNQPNALVYPSLVYIFDSIEQHIRPQTPTLLILDEAWMYFKNQFFADYIQKWLKQLRKKNAFVMMATQELKDIIDSPLVDTILQNCYTRIFLANDKAEEVQQKKSYQALGLTDNDIHVIKTLAQTANPRARFSQLICQEGTMTKVNWIVREDLACFKTPDEMKKEFAGDLE